MTTTLVGVDCATEPQRTGLVRAELRGRRAVLLDAELGGRDAPPVHATVAGWVSRSPRSLVAIDAPLGWPAALGPALAGHRAGERLAGSAEALFRRRTDAEVRARIGKNPLEVGADRIARTARMALETLDRVRAASGRPIPLAWSPAVEEAVAAIEVYPGATLAAHALPSSRYKRRHEEPARRRILDGLRAHVDLGPHEERLAAAPDVLDAAVCVLAGLDFLAGRAVPPAPLDDVVRTEGWIWVRAPVA